MNSKAKREENRPKTDKKTEFNNALEISAYLESEGWKVSKSTVYKHIREAKLRPDIEKKRYSLKAVLRYARAFLVTEQTMTYLAPGQQFALVHGVVDVVVGAVRRGQFAIIDAPRRAGRPTGGAALGRRA